MQNTLCRRRCHHACVFLYLLNFEIEGRGGEGRGGGGARAVEININGDLGEGNLGESFCRLRLRFTLAIGYFLV